MNPNTHPAADPDAEQKSDVGSDVGTGTDDTTDDTIDQTDQTAETRAIQPRSAVISLFGAWLVFMDNWIAVADLLTLLNTLGLEGPAVRAAVARLKRKGLLASETQGNVAGYRATEDLKSILTEGESTIFATKTPARLDDGWILAVFSVPEAERDRRNQLRNSLTSLGFGPVAAGVFMAPHHVETNTRRLLTRNKLSGYVHLFQARHLGFDSLENLTNSAWDDQKLGDAYRLFTDSNQSAIQKVKQSPTPDRDAFIACMYALEDWRPLPYLDPGLPDEVQGFAHDRSTARDLFAEIGAELKDLSNHHVKSVLRQHKP